MMTSGFACGMAKVLHLKEDLSNIPPFNREMNKRLLYTLAVMDRTLTPSLNRPCYISADEVIGDPLPESGEFNDSSPTTVFTYIHSK